METALPLVKEWQWCIGLQQGDLYIQIPMPRQLIVSTCQLATMGRLPHYQVQIKVMGLHFVALNKSQIIRQNQTKKYIMERFYIMKYEMLPNHWLCVDVDNDLICSFEGNNFDENHQFTVPVTTPEDEALDRIASEMYQWLEENHAEKI
jgi:hypothetical protein